jgi:acetyl-CoA carboxylase alpha subunit
MSETEPSPTVTPRQLFDEVISNSNYSHLVTEESGPAFIIFHDAKSAAGAINLIRGYADYLSESGPTDKLFYDGNEAVRKALEIIKPNIEDAAHRANANAFAYQIQGPRVEMWRRVFSFFDLENEAAAQLSH